MKFVGQLALPTWRVYIINKEIFKKIKKRVWREERGRETDVILLKKKILLPLRDKCSAIRSLTVIFLVSTEQVLLKRSFVCEYEILCLVGATQNFKLYTFLHLTFN